MEPAGPFDWTMVFRDPETVPFNLYDDPETVGFNLYDDPETVGFNPYDGHLGVSAQPPNIPKQTPGPSLPAARRAQGF